LRGLGSIAAVLGIAVWVLAAPLGAFARAAESSGDDVQVGFRDGTGKDIDASREHASLERTPPERAPASADAHYDDPDALRVTVTTSASSPPPLGVESIAASGTKLDRIPEVPLEPAACAAGAPSRAHCFASAPLRFVVDEIDRAHPVVETRSVRAEVGGA